jgi:hypothetical protein
MVSAMRWRSLSLLVGLLAVSGSVQASFALAPPSVDTVLVAQAETRPTATIVTSRGGPISSGRAATRAICSTTF